MTRCMSLFATLITLVSAFTTLCSLLFTCYVFDFYTFYTALSMCIIFVCSTCSKERITKRTKLNEYLLMTRIVTSRCHHRCEPTTKIFRWLLKPPGRGTNDEYSYPLTRNLSDRSELRYMFAILRSLKSR